MSERPYHNLFCSYRVPSRHQREEAVDPQLEDNATKGLINLFELAPASQRLTYNFIRRFSGAATTSDARPRFFLQRGPDDVDAPFRRLVGISLAGVPSKSL